MAWDRWRRPGALPVPRGAAAGACPHAGGEPLDLGVRTLNTFLTVCRGQRMGIFSGSGVGKSVLLSMLARNMSADISVIGLVGERGREVQEFLQDDLGPAGLARSVVVVSTSDEPALMRRQAAYLTLTIAEYFRDLDKDVLVLMDSVTRFAMAQREIGLSAGEPPTAKGYTPTVFTELPRLLERAGPGTEQGTITGLFSVLVDGDDHNEPVADAVRGILDGHIVMERAIAERGRYPAINILKSISRTMPRAADPAYLPAINRARQVMATYSDMEELIRLGAYRPGSSAEVDEAIACTSRWKPSSPSLRKNQPVWRRDIKGLSKSSRRKKPKTNVIAATVGPLNSPGTPARCGSMPCTGVYSGLRGSI